MLIRGPVHSGKLIRRASTEFSFQQDRMQADAYGIDEEAAWDEEVQFDSDTPDGYEDDHQEDEYDASEDEAAFGSSDLYQSAYEDGESYEDDYALEQAAADDEAEGDEEGWDAGDDEQISEERALVPAGNGPSGRRRGSGKSSHEVMIYQELGSTAPVFIAGSGQVSVPGVLGHVPLAPRAARPRPFYMHSFLFGALVVSLVVAGVALIPLSARQPLLNAFTSWAGVIAPPQAPAVKFQNYIVHYRDTLESIASKFGVQQGGILEINNLASGDQLFLGFKIKIPLDPQYGSDFQPLLNIPMPPDTTPSPPYGFGVLVPGFDSFGVQDYFGDPWAGSFGQCTWWAAHKRPDESFGGIGDAWTWADGARARGYTVTADPVINATVAFAPGVESAGGIGHVAHVEQILPDGWVLISEMNFSGNGGGWGRVDYRYITPGPGVWFIH